MLEWPGFGESHCFHLGCHCLLLFLLIPAANPGGCLEVGYAIAEHLCKSYEFAWTCIDNYENSFKERQGPHVFFAYSERSDPEIHEVVALFCGWRFGWLDLISCRSRIKSRTTRILNSTCTRLARHVLLQLFRRGWLQRNWALNTDGHGIFNLEHQGKDVESDVLFNIWVWWIEHNLDCCIYRQKGPSPNSQHRTPKIPRIWFPGPKKWERAFGGLHHGRGWQVWGHAATVASARLQKVAYKTVDDSSFGMEGNLLC